MVVDNKLSLQLSVYSVPMVLAVKGAIFYIFPKLFFIEFVERLFALYLQTMYEFLNNTKRK